MSLRPRLAKIVGTGVTDIGKLNRSASELMEEAVEAALGQAGLKLRQLDGLVAVPSLSEPHFMEAHYIATRLGMLPNRGVTVRTIDTGGAGPVTGLLTAASMVSSGASDAVVVVAGDAVSSLDTEEFLRRADEACADPLRTQKSPVIPLGYDRIATWQRETYGVTREQLAMVSVLMSRQACRHPGALTTRELTLEEVLGSKPIGANTSLLECARRADGAAAVIVASSSFVERELGPVPEGGGGGAGSQRSDVVVLAGGEASGPLYPPAVIDEEMFSCEEAAARAMATAQLWPEDIDFFGLYDCFPICFLRAVEAVGLAEKGGGGGMGGGDVPQDDGLGDVLP
jgi:acetyl-CoA acetyltransferase